MHTPLFLLLPLLACGPKAPQPSPMDLATDSVAAVDAEEQAAAELEDSLSAVERIVADPELHPFPYTLEQFREGWTPGTELRFRITQGQGIPVTVHHWEVLSHPEPDTAEMRFTVYLEDGETPAGEPRTSVTELESLRRHASFDVSTTTREEVTLETPMGTFEGLRFTVRNPDTPGIVSTFDFAHALVGPPVRMVVTVEDQVRDEMLMISRSPLPEAAPAP